jgi:hypothetical protein
MLDFIKEILIVSRETFFIFGFQFNNSCAIFSGKLLPLPSLSCTRRGIFSGFVPGLV